MCRTQIVAIIAGALIIIGFFLPWFSLTIFFNEHSATGSGLFIDSFKGGLETLPVILPVLIAIYAIIASIRKLNTKIYAAPSIVIIAYLLYELLSGIIRGKGDLSDFFNFLRIGFHMTWIGLLLLAIFGIAGYNRKRGDAPAEEPQPAVSSEDPAGESEEGPLPG